MPGKWTRKKLMPTHDERRQSPRHQAKLKAHLLFSVLLVDTQTNADSAPPRSLNLVGQTRDISATGLGLVIPVEQIDEKYLTGEESRLQVELYLPTGPVEIRARPVRCERLSETQEKSIFTEGYLIGAQITEVSDPARFIEYLKTLA
jgi:hypothetical protein